MAAASSSEAAAEAAAWAEVRLDEPPRRRWAGVVQRFRLRDAIPALGRGLLASFADADDEGADAFVKALAAGVLKGLEGAGCREYAEEMRGIAEMCGVGVETVVLLHLSYEAEAACTSVVGRLPDGRACLARTLDWHMPELKPLTLNVRFTRGGRLVYTATTWAGYVGVLTAQRPGALAVAVNFREGADGKDDDDDDDDDDNEAEDDSDEARGKFSWPVGFLVRHAVESAAGASFDAAVALMAAAPLMSPTYIVAADGASCRGVLLTRDEGGEVRRVELAADGKSTKAKRGGTPDRHALVVQANMDWWERSKKKDTQESLPRVAVARRLLPKSGEVTVDGMWACMVADPVWEDGETIYATVMVPGGDAYYHTIVEPPKRGSSGPKKRSRRARK